MANDGGMLESLGTGLQGAGAVLSSEVYQSQADDRRAQLTNVARSLQIAAAQRELQADQTWQAYAKDKIKPGMSTSAMLDVFKAAPSEALSSPQFQGTFKIFSAQQQHELALDEKKERRAEQARQFNEKIEQRMYEYERDASRKESSDADRARATAALETLKEQQVKFHQWAVREGLDIRREGVERVRGEKIEKTNAPVEDLIKDVDQAIQMIQQSPGVTGARGAVGRAWELGKSTFTGDTNTPANDFQSHLLQIQSKWRKLPTVAANRFKADAGKIDQQIKGLGLMTNDAIAINGLTQLRATLARGLEARGGSVPDDPQAAEKPGPKEGDKQKSKSGRDMHFDGKQWVYD